MSNGSPGPAVEMRHLRLVAAIADFGSMTAAARSLNLTQPALSHQLRELEVKLRAPLFVRTGRTMVLTPAGEQLTHLARNVLEQVGSFEREVLDGEFGTARGAVRIATECYTAYHWLPAVLRGFQERWPNVELRIAAESTAAPLAALREGALDLAIVYSRISDKRLRFEALFDDELVIVTAPDHRFASRTHVRAESLRDEHLFLYSSQDRHSAILNDIIIPAGVEPASITRIQLTEAIIELVAADLGVAILARWAVAPAVRAGVVSATRIGKRGYSRTWYTAVRSDDVTPAHQLDLVELLRRNMIDGPAVRALPHLRLAGSAGSQRAT